ncbi:hypothetical protein ACFOW4_18620 [Micromonospora sp. GCM10011542]
MALAICAGVSVARDPITVKPATVMYAAHTLMPCQPVARTTGRSPGYAA